MAAVNKNYYKQKKKQRVTSWKSEISLKENGSSRWSCKEI